LETGKLEAIEDIIVDTSDTFELAAMATQLHTLPHMNNIGGQVSTREMASLYDRRFARKGSAGRPIYDAIFAAAPRCPLCGHGTVSTLDHHLPKAHYPALAVAPLNLVPACADCNKNKIDITPMAGADGTIHPYFDDIEDDLWLVAEVLVESGSFAFCCGGSCSLEPHTNRES
jgi:5-methylcytosine-specific restriction endonuclease McrA